MVRNRNMCRIRRSFWLSTAARPLSSYKSTGFSPRIVSLIVDARCWQPRCAAQHCMDEWNT